MIHPHENHPSSTNPISPNLKPLLHVSFEYNTATCTVLHRIAESQLQLQPLAIFPNAVPPILPSHARAAPNQPESREKKTMRRRTLGTENASFEIASGLSVTKTARH
jgi:hypothetical protein